MGKKMYAIISDIHGNLEALQTVLEDIRRQGIDDILCLGDVVGYGPDPENCIDLVAENCRFCLSGNHDYAVLTTARNFNPIAAQAIECVRERLKPRYFAMTREKERWKFLEDLLLRKQEGDILYVHGSPRDERNEYITHRDVDFGPSDKIIEVFETIPRLCFVGHSHRPGVIAEDYEFLSPPGIGNRYKFGDAKAVINVGSIGQPRDGDNRTCYVTVTDEEVVYHRLEYDYHTTMAKIKKIGCLHNLCADRLAEGR